MTCFRWSMCAVFKTYWDSGGLLMKLGKSMHLTFNKQKFKRLISITFSVLVTWLIPTFCIAMIGLMLQQVGFHVGSNPLKPHSVYDAIMLICWIISPIIAVLSWFYTRKHSTFNIINSFFTYPAALFLMTLIPLFVDPEGRTPNSVRLAVNNTKVFYLAYYAVLVIAFILNLSISRSALKKSNWWLFIVAVPYLLTGIWVYGSQQKFVQMLDLKYFSFASLAAMLKTMHFSDVRLMNPCWYQTIALVTVSTLIILGVNFGEIVWEKTKKWRAKV